MGNRTVRPKAAASTINEADERAMLVARAAANPNEFFSFRECGIILGFGATAMGVLNAAGAPVAFRKMNPALIRQWIAENPTLVSRGSEEEK